MSNQPEYLTVEEAAKLLRIGRTSAYALAREWRETGGLSGLPVVELGRQLRVPRSALEGLHATVTTPNQDSETDRPVEFEPQAQESRRRRRRWGA